MTTFRYFGYGSNMLSKHLQARCNSAVAVGVAILADHSIAFSKRSRDGSGKTTIVPQEGANVHGVMFEIPLVERKALDKAEGKGVGYDRLDDIEVLCSRSGRCFDATTYVAMESHVDRTLKPFDWYHALVIAGADERGLQADYIAMLRGVEFMPDTELNRKGRREALKALDAAGYLHDLAYPE